MKTHNLNVRLKDFLKNIFNYNKKLSLDIDRRISKIINKIDDPCIFFDVGSGKGYFTEKLLKLRGNSVYHLFEPVKNLCDLSKEKFKNNNNVFINNYSLSNYNDKKDIYKSFGNKNFGVNTYLEDIKLSEVIKEKTISITLDQYCKYNKIKNIDFIKIDTDGYEANVLDGFLRTLSNIDNKPFILIKLKWGSNHPKWDYCKNIFNEVIELGYYNKTFDRVKNDTYVLFEPLNF